MGLAGRSPFRQWNTGENFLPLKKAKVIFSELSSDKSTRRQKKRMNSAKMGGLWRGKKGILSAANDSWASLTGLTRWFLCNNKSQGQAVRGRNHTSISVNIIVVKKSTVLCIWIISKSMGKQYGYVLRGIIICQESFAEIWLRSWMEDARIK